MLIPLLAAVMMVAMLFATGFGFRRETQRVRVETPRERMLRLRQRR